MLVGYARVSLSEDDCTYCQKRLALGYLPKPLMLGAPHFGSADRPREAQIRLPGFALPGDLVE